MKKSFAILMLAAGALLAASTPQIFTGVITDTMCKNDHSMMHVTPDSKCVRDCVRADPNTYKYALTDGKNLYVLSDQKTPEKYAAQKVRVKGVLNQKTSTIQVESITPVK